MLKFKIEKSRFAVRVCLSHLHKNVFHDAIHVKFTNAVLFKSYLFVDDSGCNNRKIYSYRFIRFC